MRPKANATLKRFTGLDSRFTFENFRVTDANRGAVETALACVSDKIRNYPLLIIGSKGAGKTHLLHAIGNAVLELTPWLKFRYQNVQQYLADERKHRGARKEAAFYNRYLYLDFWLVDDVHTLAGNEDSQEAFYFVAGSAMEHDCRVVMTSEADMDELRISEAYGRQLLAGGTPALLR